MSLSLRLDVRQSQSLVMTPQLQQAIKLLQLPNLELTTYVAQELEQNPFLERPDDAVAVTDEAASPRDADGTLSGDPGMAADAEPGDGWSGAADDGWAGSGQDGVPDGLGIRSLEPSARGGSLDFNDRQSGLEAAISRPETLREHLSGQLLVDMAPGAERSIGLHLIEHVDDAGYLTELLDDIATRLGRPLAQVEAVLERLQQLDPPGVFARSLKECLELQLRDAGRLDPAMAKLLENLDLLAQADFGALIRICGVLPDDLPEMVAEIKALNPKPGETFVSETVQTAVPDVFVLPTPGGGWRIELNEATLPKVLVDKAYYVELVRQAGDRRTKEYLSERFQSANWLVKALDQRARTVLRVAEAVVARQLPFLQHGVQRLRPLVLRDIAAATELHESTVSRATADKYVATPRGNYSFRFFFSNGLPATSGDASHSAEAIRHQIKAMIEREDPTNVLSDDQIVAALQDRGIAIARRTVAKYRESLAIPSSVQRRRAKALRLA
jgi:RNA polymerase sigma-54 factor